MGGLLQGLRRRGEAEQRVVRRTDPARKELGVCRPTTARERPGEWKIRLRTAVTGTPEPVGIWSSVRPGSDWSKVLLPTRAWPLTPRFTVPRENRAAACPYWSSSSATRERRSRSPGPPSTSLSRSDASRCARSRASTSSSRPRAAPVRCRRAVSASTVTSSSRRFSSSASIRAAVAGPVAPGPTMSGPEVLPVYPSLDPDPFGSPGAAAQSASRLGTVAASAGVPHSRSAVIVGGPRSTVPIR